MTEDESKPLYKSASAAVEKWLKLHKGETFDLDTICRQLEIHDADKRNLITIKLFNEVKQGTLEKHNRIYTIVNKDIINIPWYEADGANTISIQWPRSHLDDDEFSFAPHVVISQGQLIVLAGVSNMGKSCFAQNFLFENMDAHPCLLMVNEYNPGTFKRRISKMDWINPLKEDGTPKFKMIERHGDWKYAIEPDSINIIDWINIAEGDFWKIGTIMEDIQTKLKGGKGMALIVLQKSGTKDLGTGGQYSEHLASVYLTLDYNRLTVRKVKEHDGAMQPNGKIYGFEIIDGVHFANIRELRQCPKCHGRCLQTKIECVDCHSTGFVDKGI
jgi:hypothetical protein